LNAIIKYLKEFYYKEFNLYYFIAIVILLATLIYLNYWHGLEAKYVNGSKNKLSNFFTYYLLYLIPFATAFLLQLIFYKELAYFKQPWFWIIILLAPAFFSFRVNFNFHQQFIQQNYSGSQQVYLLKCASWVIKVFVVLLPVVVIWFLKDKNNQPFYGTAALQSVKPYLIMLLIMVPLIAWASTQSDFLNTYPKAKFITLTIYNNKPWRYIFYELCYGFDFVSIEFFFRGFLILALLQICGTHCIIPVACFYCTIHFGKPMAEAISSFFGGMLLGIISFNTSSIWGGLIVHLGIAWMMEVGGWIGSIFKKP
jgi:membrane protease YdiL (CAAX protease family)